VVEKIVYKDRPVEVIKVVERPVEVCVCVSVEVLKVVQVERKTVDKEKRPGPACVRVCVNTYIHINAKTGTRTRESGGEDCVQGH
jgi:hypothetical protein